VAYKTILVHVDAGARSRDRVAIAVSLAKRFDAHLVGLNALPRSELPGYILAGAGGAPIVDIQKRLAREQGERAKTVFDDAVSAAGFRSAEWRTSDLDAADAFALHGRYADLIVLGQPSGEGNERAEREFVETTLLEAGRPVLMVPYAGRFPAVGTRVLVGWNASRESTRAVTDAIPFLRQAESVTVLAINPDRGEHGASPGNDIALYLARHGIRVEAKVDRGVEIDAGGELLSRAADIRADLIVMGAYGRSRFRELVMGGASRTIIDAMTVPVLLSH